MKIPKLQASLGASHEISTRVNNGDGVLLNGSRLGIATKSEVVGEDLSQIQLSKTLNSSRRIVSRHIDRNIIILVEVDSGQVTLKQLTAKLRWHRSEKKSS